jgi:hypothetical protein
VRMKLEDLRIDKLLLDEKNPRLPEELTDRSPDSLANHLANEYNTVEVARSIAEHGFFDSEPLIVVKEKQGVIVVEGNRRLCALKLLSDSALRARLDLEEADEWEELAERVELEETVPVRIATSRQAVAPIIGYRHISGIEPWDPWAKARFLANQIEVEGLSFDETARIVGEDESDIRAHYRNYRVVTDAENRLKISAKEVKKKFGFFNRAMTSVGLREHIGAPPPSEVSKDAPVLKTSKKKEVGEVFSWLFGDAKTDAVITDSRQVSALGDVVASPEGLEVLRQTRNLEDAMMASGGVKQRLLKRLGAAVNALEKAELDIGSFCDDEEVVEAVNRCADALNRLQGEDEA